MTFVFYYFNFKKGKKVFLGDGGSMLLGTVVMIYILNVLGSNYSFDNEYSINKTLFSVLVLIYPLFDLLRVFILRIKKGASPFKPDKNHIHHLIQLKRSQMLTEIQSIGSRLHNLISRMVYTGLPP
mgnify:CR=1 FL=1